MPGCFAWAETLATSVATRAGSSTAVAHLVASSDICMMSCLPQRNLEKCMDKPAAVSHDLCAEPRPGLLSSEAAAAQLDQLKVSATGLLTT